MRHLALAPWALGFLALAGNLGLAAPQDVPAPAPYSWQMPHARVVETGDLEWSPQPFRFERGASVRYIDYDGGDDLRDGLTRETAWKRHPWDAEARGRSAECKGVHTYVFKKGAAYRGTLPADESGEPGNPIRLTSDPSWGTGEAALFGSVALRQGWTRGAGRPEIPEPEQVWWRDLGFAPRNVWMVNGAGEVTRIPLARTPNWTVSNPDDVKSEWWQWNYPTGRPFDVFTKTPQGTQLHLGIDTEHLTREREYYEGAIVWSEYGWVMSDPYPARVEVVDTEQRGLGFGGPLGGASASRKIIKGNRYFLEDKPHYLDDPSGEFWFDKQGEGGRLYLRLPEETDPNTVRIEAARHPNLIDSQGMSHVHVSGLTFRFTNVFWDLTATEYRGDFSRRYELNPAAVRLVGAGRDIRVSHCLFEHLYMAVFMQPPAKGQVIDRVVVSDNEIRYTDGGGIAISEGSLWGHTVLDAGLLKDVKVMRNRLHEVGRRPSRYGNGVAVDVVNGETVEIAGNILSRTWGLGINMPGGKRNGASWDVPLTRILCHHNKVTDPLLNINDFGGIETWQGGSFYVYNNVVGNPGGYQHWNTILRAEGYKRFGHAYYLDGAFKNYLFNNIGWGRSADVASPLGNRAAIQEIHSFQNTFFNNTFHNFVKGSRRQAPQGGRNKYLGNVWDTIGDWVFRHADPARTPAAGNEADAGPASGHFALETNAYKGNVFHRVARFATLKPSGQWHESFDEARQVLRDVKAMECEMGVVAETSPLRDAPGHDFRPAPGSAAAGRGVKVFVPWALSRTVGEWSFCPAGDDATQILDEHWYMTPYHLERGDYHRHPRFPLKGVNIDAGDYVEDPLEDWTRGALRLNGRDQYAVAANATMNGPLEYTVVGRWAQQGQRTRLVAEGESFASPQVYRSNFLVEVYFRAEPGHTGGVLVEKMEGAGYSLAIDGAGKAVLTVKGAGAAPPGPPNAGGDGGRTLAGTAAPPGPPNVGGDGGRTLAGTAAPPGPPNVGGDGGATLVSTAQVNDGEWHHVIAECDRGSRTLTLYVDGKKDASGAGLGPDVSLANGGDLRVGGTPQGRCLAGTLGFLRISLGTLADARTDIAELYAWQFDGPFLRDFVGRKPSGRRDAGAIQGER